MPASSLSERRQWDADLPDKRGYEAWFYKNPGKSACIRVLFPAFGGLSDKLLERLNEIEAAAVGAFDDRLDGEPHGQFKGVIGRVIAAAVRASLIAPY